MKKIVYLFLIIVFIMSCRQGASNKKQYGNVKSIVSDEVVNYKMKDILVKDTTCRSDTLLRCTHVSMKYPEFYGNNSKVPNKLIYDFILKHFGWGSETDSIDDIQKCAGDFLTDFYDFRNSFPETSMVWYFILNSYPVFEKDSLLCFAFETTSYTGGAHDLSGKYFITLNRYTGKKISPLTLVPDIEKFKKVSEDIFRKTQNIKPDADFSTTEFWFPDNKFALPNNIGINDTGFILRYNAYEIACYAKGPTEITVPFKEIGIEK